LCNRVFAPKLRASRQMGRDDHIASCGVLTVPF
jgi:hypothetical protein